MMGPSGEIEFTRQLTPPTPDLCESRLLYSMTRKYIGIIMVIVDADYIPLIELFFLDMRTFFFKIMTTP